MKEKILSEFKKSKIKSLEKLNQYIDYCILNNQNEKVINKNGYSKTSHHHILPKAIFKDYTNLNRNPWNGVYLLYKDHYYAHWLLTEAIDNYSQMEAFCKMHICDIKLGRIEEIDLISNDEYQKKVEESCKLRVDMMKKEYIDNEGNITTIYKENGKKCSVTKNKKYLDENGNITSKAKEGGKKLSKTLKKEYVDNKGNITTLSKERFKKNSITAKKKGKYFKLMHIENGVIQERIWLKDLKKISQSLIKATKENYLGKTNKSKVRLKYYGNDNLIGLYVIPL